MDDSDYRENKAKKRRHQQNGINSDSDDVNDDEVTLVDVETDGQCENNKESDAQAPPLKFTLGPSQCRGIVIYDEENFKYNYSTKNSKKWYWKCSEVKKNRCRVTVTTEVIDVGYQEIIAAEIPFTVNGKYGDIKKEHNHEIVVNSREKAMRLAKYKEIVSRNNQPLGEMIATAKKNITAEMRQAMPRNESMRRTGNRIRHPLNRDLNATNAIEINIPENYQHFLIFDSGQKKNDRVFIFGTAAGLDLLKERKIWSMDGTFSSTPTKAGFKQVLTVAIMIKHKAFPLLYILMTELTKKKYIEVFEAIHTKIPNGPKMVITDFEQAMMSGISNIYPEAAIQGCYFHLTQACLRKMRKLGIIPHYRAIERVRHIFRMTVSLAFLPEFCVRRGMALIIEEQANDRTKRFLLYFTRTYIGLTAEENRLKEEAFAPPPRAVNDFGDNEAEAAGNIANAAADAIGNMEAGRENVRDEGNSAITVADSSVTEQPCRWVDPIRKIARFPIPIWNLYKRVKSNVARTNNSLEASHLAMQRRLPHHPPMTIFLDEMIKRNEEILNEAAEASQMGVKRRAIPRKLDEYIVKAAKKFEIDADFVNVRDPDIDRKILGYLKKITYASQQFFDGFPIGDNDPDDLSSDPSDSDSGDEIDMSNINTVREDDEENDDEDELNLVLPTDEADDAYSVEF